MIRAHMHIPGITQRKAVGLTGNWLAHPIILYPWCSYWCAIPIPGKITLEYGLLLGIKMWMLCLLFPCSDKMMKLLMTLSQWGWKGQSDQLRWGGDTTNLPSSLTDKRHPFLIGISVSPWWRSSQSSSADRIWRSPLIAGLSLLMWWACHVITDWLFCSSSSMRNYHCYKSLIFVALFQSLPEVGSSPTVCWRGYGLTPGKDPLIPETLIKLSHSNLLLNH